MQISQADLTNHHSIFQVHTTAESIVLDAANWRPVNAERFVTVTEHFGGDFDAKRLSTQLAMLNEVIRVKGVDGEANTLGDVVNGLKQLGDAQFMYSKVNTAR